MAGTPAQITIADTVLEFSPRALEGFPEAPAFLADLLGRRKSTARPAVAAHTAQTYAVHVARARRQGIIDHPSAITNVTTRTAVNAYWRFVRERRARARKMLTAVLPTVNKHALDWLRISSCVGAYPGKVVPGFSGTWEPCATATLHIPRGEVAPHADPCPTCAPLPLTEDQIAGILQVIELVHGTTDTAVLDKNALLLGLDLKEDGITAAAPRMRVVGVTAYDHVAAALAHATDLNVEHSPSTLVQALGAADAVYLTREACRGNVRALFDAICAAWNE